MSVSHGMAGLMSLSLCLSPLPTTYLGIRGVSSLEVLQVYKLQGTRGSFKRIFRLIPPESRWLFYFLAYFFFDDASKSNQTHRLTVGDGELSFSTDRNLRQQQFIKRYLQLLRRLIH